MNDDVRRGVLKAVAYFQVFNYPLTIDEIWRFMPVKCSKEKVASSVQELVELGIIFRFSEYYSLKNDAALISRRIHGNSLGKKKLGKAFRLSRLLGCFPFVEGVYISGSLSKDYAEEDSDLDYFIITAANRLWIARNLLHCFRKLTFLFRAESSFCMNYFISLSDLEIAPRSYYTAIELSTLKTAWEHAGAREIVDENGWVSCYLPNGCLDNNICEKRNRKNLFTQMLEKVINMAGGDKLERWFYINTMKRWAAKWSILHYDVNLCMRSAGLHYNTPVNYPVHLPDKILAMHEVIYSEAIARYRSAEQLAAVVQEDEKMLLGVIA